MNTEQRIEVERKVVAFLFNTMARHNWRVDYIFDGEYNVRYADWTETAVLDTVFSVDESLIRFMKSAMCRSVRIILGNDGYDCIADHSLSDTYQIEDDFEAVMKLVDTYSTSLQSLEAGGGK